MLLCVLTQRRYKETGIPVRLVFGIVRAPVKLGHIPA